MPRSKLRGRLLAQDATSSGRIPRSPARSSFGRGEAWRGWPARFRPFTRPLLCRKPGRIRQAGGSRVLGETWTDRQSKQFLSQEPLHLIELKTQGNHCPISHFDPRECSQLPDHPRYHSKAHILAVPRGAPLMYARRRQVGVGLCRIRGPLVPEFR